MAPISARRPVPTEKVVQAAVVALYTRAGCTVYSLSQPRETMQSSGLPDLFVFGPQSKSPARRPCWWHEVKRPGGRYRPDQRAFANLACTSDTGWVGGGLEDAWLQLSLVGLARRDPIFGWALTRRTT